MRLLPAVVAGLATVVSTLTVPVFSATPDPTTAATVARAPSVEDAVVGSALPINPRVPHGALLVGADDDYALYHSGHVDPGSEQVDYTLVALADGRVVRTFQAPTYPIAGIRLVDGVIVQVAPTGTTRYDAASGAVTGSIPAATYSGLVALDDEWVMSDTTVRWFDGRPPVPLSQQLDVSAIDLRQLGDSTLAVVADTTGQRPYAVTPATGEVVSLDRDDGLSVFAARGGPQPVLYGASADGIVRWTDPAHDAGRTVVDSDAFPFGGGLAGDRVLVLDGDHVAELDPVTGEVGAPILDVLQDPGLGMSWPAYGDPLAQAADGLVVSGGRTPQGELSLVTAAGVRDLGTPRPSPLGATTLYRSADTVQAAFRENGEARGSAQLVVGDVTWTALPGPAAPPAPAPDPEGTLAATCLAAATSPTTLDVRGRWQLERCAADEVYVTDRSRVVAPWRVPGYRPQLGADHVVYDVAEVDGDTLRQALGVTGLDARHTTRVYGPMTGTYSVDLTGDDDPVYVDPTGRVRVATAAGLADTTGPVARVVDRPAAIVSAVRPRQVSYATTVTDDVDGDDVVVVVQTRRSARRGGYAGWQNPAGGADGRVTVDTRAGQHLCFRTLAADRSGNVTVSLPTCTLVPADDRVLRVAGRVRRQPDRRFLGGSAAVLAGPRAALLADASESGRVVLWLRTGPARGTLVVRQHGRGVQRVDTRSPRPGLRIVTLARPGSVRLQAAGPRPVLVDAVGERYP